MLKKYTLKKQFTISFIAIIITSMISTLICITFSMHIINTNDLVHVANYYEKQVPKIEEFVRNNSNVILNNNFKEKIEEIIPSGGMSYRVINLNTNEHYGNLEHFNLNKDKILYNINYTNYKNGFVTKIIPISNDKKSLDGVLCVKYTLEMEPVENKKFQYEILKVVVLFSPFVFIILYTYIFGKKFSKNINEPIEILVNASNKIKNYDLDFELKYPYNNELGNLIKSFEAMRYELKITLEKNWKVEKEKKDMISALSHDLRTPLTLIKGHVELLEEGSYKNENRLLKYLKIIENSTNRSIALVEDLNALFKVENSDFKLCSELISIKNFINFKFEEYKIIALKNNVDLVVNMNNISDEMCLNIDKLRLSQVLDNIVMNSFRYTPFGGKIILNTNYKDNCLDFQINDNGIGFTEEDFKSVFTKFYRGDKSRSQNGNSGLGLYISKILVEKHGGNMKIYNNNYGGATIEFYIKSIKGEN